ncbi:meiosis-specific with OB domain-containing protein-like [Plodia interpunctella]|uniref:meiosis-specific with OB domain-containing protein-like n=1 Tax=Plodia interpunctella TaxID=58824 RepID=UPI002368973E|nr:meiosis-specific with OB domain-containing protein-like [Plodia interpunctella]
MAGVQKVRLNNLNTNLRNALIIGIIVAKNSPRIIGSKKKNGETRGITNFTMRDSNVDTINIDVWGSEYYVITIYERFLVGDVVEISSPKICVKGIDNEIYRPQVSSPFYLSLSEGMSEVTLYSGDTYSSYLPLLHVPTKPAAGYCGIAEILKLQEQSGNVYVDLLVVVKSVSPVKSIRTKIGTDMTVRSVELLDNTTPASLTLDTFDIDTIQRAEEWRCLESVLFIADARVSWRNRGVKVQVCSRTVVTHQPYTADAESLRLYIRNQSSTRGGEIAAWAAWSGERVSSASVAQIRDRLANATPFCASLHALLIHLDLDELLSAGGDEEIRVRFADHTGEMGAHLQITILEDSLGCSGEQLKAMSTEERSAIRWRLLLEQCYAKLAASPPRLMVLSLRRASPADPIPLY